MRNAKKTHNAINESRVVFSFTFIKSINPKKITELVEYLGDLSGIGYDLIKLETYHIDEDTGKKSNIM